MRLNYYSPHYGLRTAAVSTILIQYDKRAYNGDSQQYQKSLGS